MTPISRGIAAIVLALCASVASPDLRAQAAKPMRTVIHAGTLIAEPGKPVRTQQSIIIEGGKITAIQDGYVAGDDIIDLTHSWVMPGLIDLHTHVTGPTGFDPMDPAGWVIRRMVDRPARTLLAAIPVARQILDNGFTTVRNIGDPASVTYDLRDAINRGAVDGPRMLVAETQVTTSGGDYTASFFGLRPEVEAMIHNRGECSGVDDCRRVVREEIKRGADVIKFRIAGISMTQGVSPPAESAAEVNAIIKTSHDLKRTVATHTMGNDASTLLAVEAGTNTIEHGPVGDSVIAAMKRHGTTFVPTLTVYELIRPVLQKLGVMQDLEDQAFESVRKAYAIGVPIGFGTDLTPGSVNDASREFGKLVEAGLSPVDALRAATMVAADAMNMGDQIGSIAAGKSADIIATDKDPLANVAAMREVSFVMKQGRTYKGGAGASKASAWVMPEPAADASMLAH